MMQTSVSASFTSVESCCSSPSTSYQSEDKEKTASEGGFPKRLAQTIVFKWIHGKLRVKHAMQKIITRKYKVKTVEEHDKERCDGAIQQKSILYDCLSNIGPIAFSKATRTCGLEDLPNKVLLKIMEYVEDPRPLASVNTRFHRIVVDNVDSLKRVTLNRDIVYRFDLIKRKTRIFVLKKRRSIYTPEREADVLEDVFQKSPVSLNCEVVFETDVPVAEEVFAILALHRRGLLTVSALTFTGGAMSTGLRPRGADLSDFTTTSFLEFVRLLAPDLRHINLFTSKHFRYDLELFDLVNEIDSLNILFASKSGFTFTLTPLIIKSVAKEWLSLPDPQDVTVSARLAPDSEPSDFAERFSTGEFSAATTDDGVIRTVVCTSRLNGSSLTFELFE